MIFNPTSPTWWAALAAAIGGVAAVFFGPSIGAATQAAVVGVAGVVVAIAVQGHHAVKIAETQAAAQIGTANKQLAVVHDAAYAAVRDHLEQTTTLAAIVAAPVVPAPGGISDVSTAQGVDPAPAPPPPDKAA